MFNRVPSWLFCAAEMEKGEVKLSPAMSEIVKAVQQSKWTLMRTRQQLSRGYKEVSRVLKLPCDSHATFYACLDVCIPVHCEDCVAFTS